MIIPKDILLAHGGTYKNFSAGETIFYQDSTPKNYFQIIIGSVELIYYNEDGREFTENILSDGHCIGESSLFTDQAYPINAIAKTPCTIIKLSKDEFLHLLEVNPEISLKMLSYLSDQLYFRYLMSTTDLSDPPYKIKVLLDYLKSFNPGKKYSFQVPLTRIQIAKLTGLRGETVIRTIKKMEKEHILQIRDRQIFY